MNPTPNDELLSAYLDGELSADERARVERLLAQQPESRALLEDLRALRSGLEGLPRHRLEGDFAERVLRRAEREMLAPESDASPTHSLRDLPGTPAASPPAVSRRATPATAEEDGSVSDRWPWRAGRRTWAWAGLAAAAALLVMLFTPDRVADREAEHIAKAPAPAALPEGEPRVRRNGEGAEDSIELRMDKAASPREPLSKAAPFADNETPPAPSEDGPALVGKDAMDDEGLEGQGPPGMRSKAPEAAASQAPAAQLKSAPAPRGSAASRQAGARGAARDPRLDDRPASPTRTARQPKQSGAAGLGGRSPREIREQSAPEAGTPDYRFDASDEEVLVVVCDVPQSATYRKAFESLLAGQNIDLESPVELRLEQQVPADDGDKAAGARLSTENMVKLQRRLAAGALDRVAKESLERSETDQNASAEVVDVQAAQEIVYVEATAEQLEATLENMAESETFFNMKVDPAPAVPAQESWTAYSRKLAELSADEAIEAGQRQRLSEEKKAGRPRAGDKLEDRKETARAKGDVAAKEPRGKAQRFELAPIEPADEKTDARGGLAAGTTPKPGRHMQRSRLPGKDPGKAALPREADARGASQTDLYRAVFVFRELPQAPAEPAAESAPPAKE